nr:hypothetical protein [Cellulomonas sp.]
MTLGDAEARRDGALTLAVRDGGPNLADLLVAEAGLRKGATSGLAGASDHVADVLGLRTELEVLGVAARRVVAAMPDDHAVGDRPVRDLPRGTVRGDEAVAT